MALAKVCPVKKSNNRGINLINMAQAFKEFNQIYRKEFQKMLVRNKIIC
jgi:hypothetical protein